eukprot:207521-Amorphochlora_amoeboformis.AAC.1
MYDKLLSTFESTDPELWSDMISTSKHWSKVRGWNGGCRRHNCQRVAFWMHCLYIPVRLRTSCGYPKNISQHMPKPPPLLSKLMATHHDYVTDSNAMKQERISEYEVE